MDAVLRALSIYVVLLMIFRISGKRTLAQITTFDFVLLLIVGEATQQALLGDDFSVTNGLLVVTSLVGIDVVLSFVKEKVPVFGKVADGMPVVILENGKPIDVRLKRARIDPSDIVASARETHGLERLDQIKYAVLEESGSISVIPYRQES